MFFDSGMVHLVLNKLRSNSLLSGSAVYLFSNILNAAIPFALLPVLTRYLTPAEYGEVAMFQTLLGALAAFVGVSVAGAANRKYYDDHVDMASLRNFIAACLQILLVTSLIAFGMLSLFSGQLAELLAIKPGYITVAVLVTAASVIIQLRLGQWQVRKQATHYGFLQVSQSLCNMLLSLLLVVVLLQGAGGRINAQVWVSIAFACVALIMLNKDKLLGFFSWQPAYLKEALSFGVPLIPHVAGVFLLSSVDRFVINAEIGLAEAGIYMVAVQLTGAMGLVFDAINKAYVPWLFERLKRNRFEEKKQIVLLTYVWFGMILIGTGLAFLIGPWLVVMIAGEKYRQAGEVIGWLALGQAFGGMYLMVTNYIFYSKKTGLLSFVTISSGLLNLALLIFLIRMLGFSGAAVAYCASMFVRFMLTWWVAQKRHPMPWFNFSKSKFGNVL